MLRSKRSGESDFVKEHINAVARIACASINRVNVALADAFIKRTCNFTPCELLTLKEFLHKLLIGGGDCLCEYIEHLVYS